MNLCSWESVSLDFHGSLCGAIQIICSIVIVRNWAWLCTFARFPFVHVHYILHHLCISSSLVYLFFMFATSQSWKQRSWRHYSRVENYWFLFRCDLDEPVYYFFLSHGLPFGSHNIWPPCHHATMPPCVFVTLFCYCVKNCELLMVDTLTN